MADVIVVVVVVMAVVVVVVMVGWLWSVGWFVGWFVGWMACLSFSWLVGCCVRCSLLFVMTVACCRLLFV